MALSERLPPLTALRAFEAAARHLSFAKAAEELYVTPAALSYQIKSLETDLGVQLFRRLNRAVELTEAGRLLAPGVSEGFEALKAAVRNLNRMREGRGLILTAGPAFTAKWLAPRIFRFIERRPDIEVRIVASLKKLDFRVDLVPREVQLLERGPISRSASSPRSRSWTSRGTRSTRRSASPARTRSRAAMSRR